MTERTSFTPGSAKRIADVVRKVEQQRPEGAPLSFHRIDYAKKDKLFRVCTFTGSWSKNTDKTVTFKYQTSTPNTVSATNLFFPVTGTAGGDCGIAKDGTAWFLIDVPMFTATAVFSGATASTAVMRDVTLSASLNTSNCTITIAKTLSTTSVILMQSTFTATFVKFEA